MKFIKNKKTVIRVLLLVTILQTIVYTTFASTIELSNTKDNSAVVIDANSIVVNSYIFSERYFRFKPTTSTVYTITSSSLYDSYGTLYDESGISLISNDDCECGTNHSNFSISYSLIANHIYYIGVFTLNDDNVDLPIMISGGNLQSFIWTGTSFDSWNDVSKWNWLAVPNANNTVTIDGELHLNQSVSVNDFTILSNSNVTVGNGYNLSYSNFYLKSDVSGTATFISNQSNMSARVEQYLTGFGGATPNGRYWYISSPISNATSTVVDAASANVLKSYDETKHTWVEVLDNTTTLPVGTGYFARLGASTTATYTGTLNNGDITLSPSRSGTSDEKRGFNLVGNPYPSYLNWDDVGKTNIQTTMWYRAYNGLSMVFDTYNALGEVGTDNNGTEVNKFIPPMQAFWVRVSNDGDIASLTFKNSMRSHQTGNLLKSNTQNDIIRLKVSNGTNSDEAIVVFNADATNGIDAFDSEKMSNNDASIPELYTVANSQKLVINGLESAVSNPIIPLGFKTAKAGTYTITAKAIEGLNGVPVILEDKLLNKIQDLTQSSSYSFSSDSVDNASRFVLRLKSTTIVNEIAESINVYAKSQAIAVTTTETIGKITITDVLGRTIATQTIVGTQTDIEISSGVYFVKVQTSNGVVTKQVVVE